jgi:hypothetical protein
MRSWCRRGFALTVLAAGLSACEGVPKDRGICPRVAILADAGQIVKFADGAPETPQNVVFRGRMTDVRITCKYRDQQLTEMEADVVVTMVLERGPALRGDVVQAPYFVAVTDRRGTVLQKREFPMRISFAGNPAVEHTETSWQFFRFRRGFSGLEYETWTGFQLADREIEYNRRTTLR